jgi:hypothetical protein
VKYRQRVDYEEEEEEEEDEDVHGDEAEPSLESELFALALNRKNSVIEMEVRDHIFSSSCPRLSFLPLSR